VYAAFFRPPPDGEAAHGEAPWPMIAAMMATSVLVLGFAAYAGVPLALARALAGG
jgi:hypothetical protein